jgi:glutathione S-transferase
MKLYIGKDTCARAAQLVANELYIRHELVYVDIFTKAMSIGEDFATVNPLLYIPVIRLDNYDQDIIPETIIISSYLADQHPEFGMLPPPGTLERVKADQFLVQIMTENASCFSR